MPKFKFDDIAINCTEKRKPTDADMETYIGLEHLDSGSLKVTRFGSDVPIKGEKTIMHKGDVLFGKRNAYLRRAAIAPHDGLFSAHGMVLRPREEVIDKDFFPHFIVSDYFFDDAIRISVGSLSPTINWSALKELEFELPPLDEQKRLAAVLWSIDRTVEAYKNLLAKTDDLVKSQFIEMFGGIAESDYVTMRDVCSLITDGTHQPPKFSDSGIPFLFVSNITSNALIYDAEKFISEETYSLLMKRTPIEIGDILLSTVGSYGHPAIVLSNKRFSFQRHIAFLKPKREIINSVYLHGAILSQDVQRQIDAKVKGIAQRTLNLSEIKTLRFPLPDMNRQKQYASIINHLDKSKFTMDSAR